MDTVRWIFLGPFGLRSGWRAALWGIATNVAMVPFGVAVFVAVIAAGIDPTELPPHVALGLNSPLVIPVAVVTWIFVRFLDRRPLTSVGLGGGFAEAARSTALGTGIGLAAIAAGCVLLLVLGVARIAPSAMTAPMAILAVELLAAAAWEELLFRGYAFQWIVRGAGFWPAAILSSLAFGVVHAMNPNVSPFALLVIVLSGILLAYSRVASRDLWVPIGLHFGWNAAQGLVFGVPISGLGGFPSLLETRLEGPEILTGGAFGFEASLGGLVSLGAAFALLARLARKRGADWRMEGGAPVEEGGPEGDVRANRSRMS